MLEQLTAPVTFIAILGCGVTAGIMFAFSAFVMDALGRLPAPQGIAAMQTINVVIISPLFLLVFLGSTLLCLLLGGTTLFNPQQPGAMWRLLGAVLFIAGVMFVTATFNVPLNDELDKVDPASLEGAKLWEHYLTVWTRWNHVRTLTAIGATASLVIASQK